MRQLMSRPTSLSRLLLAALLVAVAAAASPASTRAQAPTANQAGLIIEYGDGQVDTFCIPFEGESITGLELLQQSGLPVGASAGGMGTQVCQIGEVGCEPGREQCFCQCLSTPCAYWTYFYWENGAWTYSPLGPGLREVRNGDVEAWVWGDGRTLPSTPPDAACAPAAQEQPADVTPTSPAEEVAPSPTAPEATAAPAATEPEAPSSLPCPAAAVALVPLALLGALAWARR
ncbi:MAG: hypothetical protein ACOYEW_14040 [Anaerolineae bacterium]|jgi:hypothetical protein